jgi:GntP family gluconate:H+ symporter
VAGPLFARLIDRHVKLADGNPLAEQFIEEADSVKSSRRLPGFGITLFTIFLPVILMLVGSWADFVTTPKSLLNDILKLIGNSVVALLIATLVSFYTFGKTRGFTRDTILKFTNECLGPTASITLVVGAGGGFGRVLRDSGVSDAIVRLAAGAHVSVLVLGWLVAAMVRIATGSATVAIATAAGIVAPIAAASPGVRPEMLVLATGAGSLILSHVNDGGFWLVKEYFNMSVPQTFKTWTVCETIISVMVLLLTLALALVV